MVRDFSWEFPFIRTKRQGPEHFQELLEAEKYGTIIKIGESMKGDEFLKYICPVVTTLDHFKGLYEYLKQRKMVPGFLAHGEMALVRKVIVETGLLQTVKIFGYCDSIYAAIALSLREDRHERVAGLFEAAQERPRLEEQVRRFVKDFFGKYPPKKTACHSNDSLTFTGKSSAKSILPFMKVFAKN